MILTCPACATQYRLKDDAIPPEGRQVRCAACKHKWHEDGASAAAAAQEGTADQALVAEPRGDDGIGGGPPQADPRDVAPASADVPPEAAREQMIAETPEPEIQGQDEFVGHDAKPEAAAEWPSDPYPPEDHGFAAIPAMHDDDDPVRGRWLGWIVGLILLVVAAVTAFYFFAPPELKARAGIAEVGEDTLEVILTTRDRQRLASNNEMVAISGRVVNLTDRDQVVPPILAELRDERTSNIVYKWTIPPPVRSLAPRASATFNSARTDVPAGAELLSLDFAG